MRVVAKIDDQGLYVEDVLLEDNQPLPAGTVAQRPPEGFHAPKWNGSEWLEGKSEEEIVASLKDAKINEFAARAVEDLDATGLFTSGHGDRETLFVMAKTLKAICQALGIPLDARLDAIAATGDTAMSKKQEIESAQDLGELKAIEWEEQA
jgi:hypothetical protein